MGENNLTPVSVFSVGAITAALIVVAILLFF